MRRRNVPSKPSLSLTDSGKIPFIGPTINGSRAQSTPTSSQVEDPTRRQNSSSVDGIEASHHPDHHHPPPRTTSLQVVSDHSGEKIDHDGPTSPRHHRQPNHPQPLHYSIPASHLDPLTHLRHAPHLISSTTPSIQPNSVMLPSPSSNHPNHSPQLTTSIGIHLPPKRSSYQSSAPSLDGDEKLWPRHSSSLGEASSCPSDNEISSLYGKYRHSGYSFHDNSNDRPQESEGEDVEDRSFTKGDDVDGIQIPQSTKVLDELKWMLGEAIDSAQSTFDNHQEIPPRSRSQRSDAASHPVPLNTFDGLLHLEQAKAAENTSPEIQRFDQSPTNLSEPATSSSASDYSDGLDGDLEESQPLQRRVDEGMMFGSSEIRNVMTGETRRRSNLIHSSTLKRYSIYGPSALTNHQTKSLQSPDRSKIGPLNHQHAENARPSKTPSVYSEEVLLSTSTEDFDQRPLQRSKSHQHDDCSALKPQASASSRQRDTPLAPLSSPPLTPSISASKMLPEDLTPMNSSLVADPQPGVKVAARSSTWDQQPVSRSVANPGVRSLTARSPIVQRSSSDATLLEQWQWLESLHSQSTPHQKPVTSLPQPGRPTINVREKSIMILNDHFTSSFGAADQSRKLKILLQRQRSLQLILHRPSNGKSIKTIKPMAHNWLDRVPTIRVKELKASKSAFDRCRMYEAKLQELYSQPSGLDLWVWLKTRGDSSSTPNPFDKGSKSDRVISHGDSLSTSLTRSQTHKLGLSASPNPLFSVPNQSKSNLPQAVDTSPSQLRDMSIGSLGSFPLRGGNPQKAIQIIGSGENQFVEIVHPEGVGHRANGMVVNSLMEVDNLPYPALYPHSVRYHHAPTTPTANPPDMFNGFGFGIKSGRNSPSVFNTKHAPESASSKSTGGFFSQMARQNSSRHRQHVRSSSISPSKNTLVISAPMISAPKTGPRGPRPSQNGSMFSEAGVIPLDSHQVSNSQPFDLHTHNKSMVDVHQQEQEEIKSPHKASRSTFADGEPHPRNGIRAFLFGSNESRSNEEELMLKKVSGIESSIHRHQHHYQVKQQHHLSPIRQRPVANDGKVRTASEDDRNNVELNTKMAKLMDILPQADRALLERVLIESGMDDMVAIGSYLELNRKKDSLMRS